MQVKSSSYFAVEILVRLVTASAERPRTAEALAESIDRSISSTKLLMSQMRKSGLLEAKQGPRGGYYLARPAERISLAEVFRALEDPITPLPGAQRNGGRAQCGEDVSTGADLLWNALHSHVCLFLEGISLADIANEGEVPPSRRERCDPLFAREREKAIEIRKH